MAKDKPLQDRGSLKRLAEKAGLPVKQSWFEKKLGREINPWARGMYFTWIWAELGLEWCWYEQFWFFRGSRDWYVLFIPYFWRSLDEFYGFEKRLIHEATRNRGRISEQEFIRQSRKMKTELNLGAIQAFLLPAATSARVGTGAATMAKVIDKAGDVQRWIDTAKCAVDAKSCEAAIYAWALTGTKGRVLKAK